ncbi:hypothetical protein C2845_PM13G08630 [Panicum miliaceum]|uniref:Uncharacterized protein n=1 Tax=Panicum miliaceum TaxID=4540 RepID=A0A3L6RET0_PANMI|nr:hypothetical protein C2845_PM13G08630 [Panicum miliaceum]
MKPNGLSQAGRPACPCRPAIKAEATDDLRCTSSSGNMWTASKNKLKKLSPSSSRRSHGTTSSRDNMSVDSSHRDTDSQEDASPVVSRSRVQGRIRVFTSVEQLVPRNDYEREALDLLKNQTYHHVKIFEPLFFIKMGLKADMTRAFSHVGWYNFADMKEPGSKFLTMEFLMTLSFEEEVEQFKLTVKELSVALGFDKKCLIDPSMLAKTYKYDRTTWWNEISEEPKMIAGRSPIDITTLVMRIATRVKALDNAQVTFLPWGDEYQLWKKEPACHSVVGTTTQRQTRSSTQQQEQAGPSHHAGTSHMSFEETYEYYTQGGTDTAGGTSEQGAAQEPYYPQVGPSSSARYEYENPVMHGITDLTTRVNTMGQQQDQLSIDLAHNIELT